MCDEKVYAYLKDDVQTLAMSRLVSCGVKWRMIDRTRTRFGCNCKKDGNECTVSQRSLRASASVLTLISLFSRNCKMTFRRYSKFTSSSDAFAEAGGDPIRGKSGVDGVGEEKATSDEFS